MKFLKRIRKFCWLYIRIFGFYLQALPGRIKRCIWNKHILLYWYRLWIRHDEFDRSLDTDIEATWGMSEKQLAKYHANLTKRRKIAHDRDIVESYPEIEM